MSTPTPRQKKSRDDVRKNWMKGRQINQELKDRNLTVAAWYLEHQPSENRDQIYKIVEFATAIRTPEELDELLAVGPQGWEKGERGRPLTWEHFVVLMRVKDPEKRLKLAQTASKMELSPAQMRLKAPKPSRKGGRPGRKPLAPKTPESVLRSISHFLVTELKRIEAISDPKQKLKYHDVQRLLDGLKKDVDSALKVDR